MNKNKVIDFPSSVDAKVQEFINFREQEILKFEQLSKKLNWFSGGFILGSSLTCIVFMAVFYFMGGK